VNARGGGRTATRLLAGLAVLLLLALPSAVRAQMPRIDLEAPLDSAAGIYVGGSAGTVVGRGDAFQGA
jgi:hypothetical protein